MEQNTNNKVRVVTFLTREQIDYLDHLGKDALFANGKKISRSEMLASLVDILIRSHITAAQLKLSDGTLPEQLLRALNDCKAAKGEQ